MPARTSWVSYVGVTLALVGLLWQVATKYQNVLDRLDTIEKEQSYFHGAVPEAVKRGS